MPPKLQAWITPGTITSIVSTLIMIGSFVGVSNYRATVQDRNWTEFKADVRKQLDDFRTDTNAKIDQLGRRLDAADADGRRVAVLEEQNRGLAAEVSKLHSDYVAGAQGARVEMQTQLMLHQKLREELIRKGVL